MRRSKKQKEPGEDAPDTPDADGPELDGADATEDEPAAVDDIAARLAPIEEFRSKSDSWMKETSAQLARISTHVAQDEKRQGKLDDRLAEFEERLQGMLQLTEAIGMDQNPFVAGKSNDHGAPGASEGPAKTAEPPGPPARPKARPIPDEDDPVVVIPADGEGYVGRPAPRHPSHPNDASADPGPSEPAEGDRTPPAREEDAHTSREAPERNDNDMAFEDPDDNPFFTGPSTLVPAGHEPPTSTENAPPARPASVKSDAREADAARAPTPRADEVRRPPTSSDRTAPDPDTDDELGPSAARDAERRLAFLQVAGLLARHLRPMEIDPFLECHAQAGWIEHRDITRIRTLASDLARNRRDPVQRIDREELHMRTILLTSRIAASFERRAPRVLDRLFEDRRKIAQSEWMADES